MSTDRPCRSARQINQALRGGHRSPARFVFAPYLPSQSRSRSLAIDRAEYRNALPIRPLARLPLHPAAASVKLPARNKGSARKRTAQRIGLGSARVSRAGFGVAPKQAFLKTWIVDCGRTQHEKFAIARRARQHAGCVRCPEDKTKLDDFAYKFPPTQRVGLVCPVRRIAQLSFFFLRRSFFGCSRDR